MSRSQEQTVTLCCPLDELEQDIAAELMRLTGIASEANLVRFGLWHLAKHLDVPVGEAFGQRHVGRKPRRNRVIDRQLGPEDIAS